MSTYNDNDLEMQLQSGGDNGPPCLTPAIRLIRATRLLFEVCEMKSILFSATKVYINKPKYFECTSKF